MKALTWHAHARTSASIEVPDPTIDRADRCRRSASPRPRSADPTCTCTTCSGRSCTAATSSGTRPWASSRRSARTCAASRVGDRVVIPFVHLLRPLLHVRAGPHDAVRDHAEPRPRHRRRALRLHRAVRARCPAGRREYLRVRRADANAQVVGHDLPDERYLFLSDILPTAWQGVRVRERHPRTAPSPCSGLGPVGQLVDPDRPPPRRAGARGRSGGRAPAHGASGTARRCTTSHDDVADVIRDATEGRGPDGVVDAVGLEAHGNPGTAFAQSAVGRAARRPREAAHDQGGRRSARGAGPGHRPRASGRHRLGQRRLRRVPRPDAPA